MRAVIGLLLTLAISAFAFPGEDSKGTPAVVTYTEGIWEPLNKPESGLLFFSDSVRVQTSLVHPSGAETSFLFAPQPGFKSAAEGRGIIEVDGYRRVVRLTAITLELKSDAIVSKWFDMPKDYIIGGKAQFEYLDRSDSSPTYEKKEVVIGLSRGFRPEVLSPVRNIEKQTFAVRGDSGQWIPVKAIGRSPRGEWLYVFNSDLKAGLGIKVYTGLEPYLVELNRAEYSAHEKNAPAANLRETWRTLTTTEAILPFGRPIDQTRENLLHQGVYRPSKLRWLCRKLLGNLVAP